MASLQSTLGISELREETLRTWARFITTLKYSDIGPFIGRTSGALIAQWPELNDIEKGLARQIIHYISNHASELAIWLEEVAGLETIPELQHASYQLDQHRKKVPLTEQLERLLLRTQSKNIAVATMSMRELKRLLSLHHDRTRQMCRGDMFDSLITTIMVTLLFNAMRDGDCQDLRDLSNECIGWIGALDPDRLISLPEPTSMTLLSNFTDPDESVDFAIHLIRDLLVDAFRATNDTKHQDHLAYAIQELLKYCGFTPSILHASSASIRLRNKWHAIPIHQHETLAPLLESRFSLIDAPIKAYDHPIYSAAPTYREWLQWWSNDLIGKILALETGDRATLDAQTIFGVCRGVLRNQDVTVAHHLLPHLVLSVLSTGDELAKREIYQEINTVLQDQVNPSGSPDKRSLSAQVIFDLMDYLSKWLRMQRMKAERGRATQMKTVDKVLTSIETELMANAALQSKAYARSLRNFEQRIIQLRRENRSDADLHNYFERVHQIYAELDEPDGMEGVSTYVISPTLEHQIREHESTGRWTSAQSCWEVRLQQSPEDLRLHLGLLKCLRNLGHYGERFPEYS
jgi:serine/threonine-protein kinase ATR